MPYKLVFNPFTANFDFAAQGYKYGPGDNGGDGDGSNNSSGVKSISVTAPITKSGLNSDPIIGTDLRSLSELP